jgi:hypothetical protein
MPWLERTYEFDYDASLITQTGTTQVITIDYPQNVEQSELAKILTNQMCEIFDELNFTEYKKINDYDLSIFGVTYHISTTGGTFYMTFDGGTGSNGIYYNSFPISDGSFYPTALTKKTSDGGTICKYRIRVFCNTNYIYIQVIPGNIDASEEETYLPGIFALKGELADGSDVTFITGNPNTSMNKGTLKIPNEPLKTFSTIDVTLHSSKNILPTNYNTCTAWFPDVYGKDRIVLLNPLAMFGNGMFVDGNVYSVNKSLIPSTKYDYFFELNGEEYYRPRGGATESIVLKL